jgi:activator of HSP90 ATPase
MSKKSPELKVATITQKVIIPGKPNEVYQAYVDTKKAAEFTGQSATGVPKVGGKMTHGDGYIKGKYLELIEGAKIVQEWSTTEWPSGYPPSILELTFKPKGKETELTMVQSKVPASQSKMYSDGWMTYYWEPLKKYFQTKKS